MKLSETLTNFAIVLSFLVVFTAVAHTATAASQKDIDDVDYFTGTIESLSRDSIAVGGETYSFAQGIQFLSAAGLPLKSHMFQVGEKVKVHVDTENKVLIVRKT